VSTAAHAAHPETSTGIDNRKLAIWTFIGSECLFFASLISVYLVNKDKSISGPTAADIFEIPLVTFGTAVLLFSSFFVVLALNGAQRGDKKKLVMWLSLTVLCGLFFVGMQVYEFQHFLPQGPGVQHQCLRLQLLCPDRIPRHPRHPGRALAVHLAGAGHSRQAAGPQGAEPRDGGALLALRGRGLDRDLPRRLPDEVSG
jgi:hypothetical protein